MIQSAVVVCRLINPKDVTGFSQTQLLDLGAEIGRLLKQARRDRIHIAHVFLAWPQLAGLLPGAEPWADETIHEASAELAFDVLSQRQVIPLGQAKQIWLCGLISYGDFQIARDFFCAQKIPLRSAPSATRFFEAPEESQVRH